MCLITWIVVFVQIYSIALSLPKPFDHISVPNNKNNEKAIRNDVGSFTNANNQFKCTRNEFIRF